MIEDIYGRHKAKQVTCDNCGDGFEAESFDEAQKEIIPVADDRSIVKNICPYHYVENADVKRSQNGDPVCYEYERRVRRIEWDGTKS